MKKPAKKPVKKAVKNKALSHRLSVAARKKALAAAMRRAKSGGTVKKRTLSLNSPHVATEKGSWLMKLGRNKPVDKPRLVLDSYFHVDQLATPAVVDFASEVVSWPMYGNDQIGDCTAACVGHEIQAWTRYTGTEVDVPEDEIIQLYSAVSGYDPKTGDNDNGAVIQDVLTYWRKSGVPVAGHKILAFAQLSDLGKVKDALWMFGSVYLGINCPDSALSQFDDGRPWTVVPGAQDAGGHAIPLQYADASGNYHVVTWGKLQGMDQGFLNEYVEEAWVVITDDWLDKNGHTPEGLDLQQLGQDLADLTGDPNPFPGPAPAPPAPKPVPADIKADLDRLEADFAKTVRDVEQVL